MWCNMDSAGESLREPAPFWTLANPLYHPPGSIGGCVGWQFIHMPPWGCDE
ncbi:hypothetical protein CGRA01v4_00184 [Colletotrichum graminicola]|nr:hypothetical protein CGRA01v4_00184 [Colletotrichum graminicola]